MWTYDGIRNTLSHLKTKAKHSERTLVDKKLVTWTKLNQDDTPFCVPAARGVSFCGCSYRNALVFMKLQHQAYQKCNSPDSPKQFFAK
mmetsp:Transcript_5213/g.11024  ORF Transcript_5213/g.11024 Transcript_5213/m.11024 type:complete len:88 (+) Transcript_5213:540-803(+)